MCSSLGLQQVKYGGLHAQQFVVCSTFSIPGEESEQLHIPASPTKKETDGGPAYARSPCRLYLNPGECVQREGKYAALVQALRDVDEEKHFTQIPL